MSYSTRCKKSPLFSMRSSYGPCLSKPMPKCIEPWPRDGVAPSHEANRYLYRGNWNRYPPSLVTGRSISGAQISTLVTGRKFRRIWQICKGGTLCKKQSGPVTILKSGNEISGIVTGSKLAARRPLKGGVSNLYSTVPELPFPA